MSFCQSIAFGNPFALTATQDYDLLPGKPLRVTNASGKPYNASCEIHLSSRENHNMLIKMLTGNGEVNGNTLKKGQSLTLAIHHTEMISIIMSANSDVEYTNLGPLLVKVMCTPY